MNIIKISNHHRILLAFTVEREVTVSTLTVTKLQQNICFCVGRKDERGVYVLCMIKCPVALPAHKVFLVVLSQHVVKKHDAQSGYCCTTSAQLQRILGCLLKISAHAQKSPPFVHTCTKIFGQATYNLHFKNFSTAHVQFEIALQESLIFSEYHFGCVNY